jgi:hypothetical protein
MTTEEIKRIEKALSVELPKHYVTFLSTFEELNNLEVDIGHFLYASADDVIGMNEAIGFHLHGKIIKNKLIIGDNGGGDYYLIDLVHQSDEKVYVFDHEETVEKCLDNMSGEFEWSKFDKYDSLDSYRISLLEMFE